MKTEKIKILIVDDHPAVRSTMIDILNEEGFETGLNKCLEHSYNFVLIDVQMPKMNGVEVFRKLKEKKEKLPQFIFFTAYSLPELKEEAMRLGCLAFLQKPIQIEKIISLIQDYKNIPVLVCLKNKDQADGTVKVLQNQGFHTVNAETTDDALIQLRQINYKFLIFDADWPGTEQEAIHNTIKTLKSNTQAIETHEDETIDIAINKINKLSLSNKNYQK